MIFLQLYYKSKGVKKFKNRNAFKLPVSDEVKQLLQANFTREIEFYDFCKQRLFSQYEEYKLQNWLPVLNSKNAFREDKEHIKILIEFHKVILLIVVNK